MSYPIQVISQLLATVAICSKGCVVLEECCEVKIFGGQQLDMLWVLVDPEVRVLNQECKCVLSS